MRLMLAAVEEHKGKVIIIKEIEPEKCTTNYIAHSTVLEPVLRLVASDPSIQQNGRTRGDFDW